MKSHVFRVVTKGPGGEYRIRDYMSEGEILRWHEQIGLSDYNIHVSMRSYPVFKGLVGPMVEADGVLRYESPEVFEQLTKEWAEHKQRCRRKKKASTRML